jgi:hypothetical protein
MGLSKSFESLLENLQDEVKDMIESKLEEAKYRGIIDGEQLGKLCDMFSDDMVNFIEPEESEEEESEEESEEEQDD